jgi:GPI inositol-deacylase
LKAPFPSVSDTLFLFTREALPSLMGASFIISLVPLPKDYVLGNEGEVAFALLSPLILLFVTGLVTVSWWMICIVIWPVRKLGHIFVRYISL